MKKVLALLAAGCFALTVQAQDKMEKKGGMEKMEKKADKMEKKDGGKMDKLEKK